MVTFSIALILSMIFGPTYQMVGWSGLVQRLEVVEEQRYFEGVQPEYVQIEC